MIMFVNKTAKMLPNRVSIFVLKYQGEYYYAHIISYDLCMRYMKVRLMKWLQF